MHTRHLGMHIYGSSTTPPPPPALWLKPFSKNPLPAKKTPLPQKSPSRPKTTADKNSPPDERVWLHVITKN